MGPGKLEEEEEETLFGRWLCIFITTNLINKNCLTVDKQKIWPNESSGAYQCYGVRVSWVGILTWPVIIKLMSFNERKCLEVQWCKKEKDVADFRLTITEFLIRQ